MGGGAAVGADGTGLLYLSLPPSLPPSPPPLHPLSPSHPSPCLSFSLPFYFCLLYFTVHSFLSNSPTDVWMYVCMYGMYLTFRDRRRRRRHFGYSSWRSSPGPRGTRARTLPRPTLYLHRFAPLPASVQRPYPVRDFPEMTSLACQSRDPIQSTSHALRFGALSVACSPFCACSCAPLP